VRNLRRYPDIHKQQAIIKASSAYDQERIDLIQKQKGAEIYAQVIEKSLANSINPFDQLVEMQHADNKAIENRKIK
jgi:hypothetical protein